MSEPVKAPAAEPQPEPAQVPVNHPEPDPVPAADQPTQVKAMDPPAENTVDDNQKDTEKYTAALESTIDTAKKSLLSSAAELAAARLAVPEERIPYVMRLVDLSEIAIGDDMTIDKDAVKAAVEKVISDIPELAKSAVHPSDPVANPPDEPSTSTARDEISKQLFGRKN